MYKYCIFHSSSVVQVLLDMHTSSAQAFLASDVAVFIYTLPWGRLPPLLVPIFLQADHASSSCVLSIFRVAAGLGSLNKVGDVLDGERRCA